MNTAQIGVNSEIGILKRILIHSPDGGIGKITPGKFHDWLYDDTVHLKKMQQEYDDYVKILLYFLDPEKINLLKEAEKKAAKTNTKDRLAELNPGRPEYFDSDKVVDAQWILSRILENPIFRENIITAACAIENCNSKVQAHLENEVKDPHLLSKILITGVIPPKIETGVFPPGTDDPAEEIFIFPPVPNFVFTRDIGIMINDHFLLSKPAKLARRREATLTRFLAIHHLLKDCPEKVIEITEDSEFFLLDDNEQEEQIITMEGGDIMMIAPNHLIVGCSERTSPNGVNEIIHSLFAKSETKIEWVSVVKVPKKRAQMHIDTIFTQVRRDTWVLYGEFSEEVKVNKQEKKKSYLKDLMHRKESSQHDEAVSAEIIQFYKKHSETYNPSKDYGLYNEQDYKKINDVQVSKPIGLDGLLRQISESFYNIPPKDVKIIYSGGNHYPYDSREQWTDSCNVLALKEGVVIGYDRNEKTIEEFEKAGFRAILAKDLIKEFDEQKITPAQVENTLILLESGELSRARGGSHCMSMPLWRENI